MFERYQSGEKVHTVMNEQKKKEECSADKSESETDPEKLLRVNSSELMRGSKEIVIEHDGKDYRLRVTSLGKLILTR